MKDLDDTIKQYDEILKKFSNKLRAFSMLLNEHNRNMVALSVELEQHSDVNTRLELLEKTVSVPTNDVDRINILKQEFDRTREALEVEFDSMLQLGKKFFGLDRPKNPLAYDEYQGFMRLVLRVLNCISEYLYSIGCRLFGDDYLAYKEAGKIDKEQNDFMEELKSAYEARKTAVGELQKQLAVYDETLQKQAAAIYIDTLSKEIDELTVSDNATLRSLTAALEGVVETIEKIGDDRVLLNILHTGNDSPLAKLVEKKEALQDKHSTTVQAHEELWDALENELVTISKAEQEVFKFKEVAKEVLLQNRMDQLSMHKPENPVYARLGDKYYYLPDGKSYRSYVKEVKNMKLISQEDLDTGNFNYATMKDMMKYRVDHPLTSIREKTLNRRVFGKAENGAIYFTDWSTFTSRPSVRKGFKK